MFYNWKKLMSYRIDSIDDSLSYTQHFKAIEISDWRNINRGASDLMPQMECIFMVVRQQKMLENILASFVMARKNNFCCFSSFVYFIWAKNSQHWIKFPSTLLRPLIHSTFSLLLQLSGWNIYIKTIDPMVCTVYLPSYPRLSLFDQSRHS